MSRDTGKLGTLEQRRARLIVALAALRDHPARPRFAWLNTWRGVGAEPRRILRPQCLLVHHVTFMCRLACEAGLYAGQPS